MGIEKPQLSQNEFNTFISQYVANLKSERDKLRQEVLDLQGELQKYNKELS